MTRELAIKIIDGETLGTTEQVNEAIAMAIEALSDAPDTNVGKWIREVLGSTSGYGTTVMYQCTNCEKMSVSKYKFCPSCGCRMESEEE